MSKAESPEKKSRSRNLKGLSVFEDEIAAPADYGDFMKIDAPVALRIAQEPQPAPEWEKFIGIDSPVLVNNSSSYYPVPDVDPDQFKLAVPANEDSAEKPELTNALPENSLLFNSESEGSCTPLVVTNDLDRQANDDGLIFNESEASPSTEKARTAAVIKPKPRSVEIRSVSKHQPQELHDFEIGGFGELVGIQRKILLFMFSDCYPRASLKTRTLTREHLSLSLSVPYDSINTSIVRLIQKSFISRMAFKRGRGGWAVYELSKEIYQELIRLQQVPGCGILTSVEPPETDTKQTQTIIEAETELSNEYEQINIQPLNHIGFSRSHIRKLAEKEEKLRLTPQEIQNSVNFFAFDIKYNNKIIDIKSKDPLRYIMGILLGGSPYSPPLNYRSPEDIARSEYLDSLKVIERNRQLEEEELKRLLMADWFKGLSVEQKNEIKASAPLAAKEPGPVQKFFVEQYFEENVWPSLKNTNLGTSLNTQISEEFKSSLSGNS